MRKRVESTAPKVLMAFRLPGIHVGQVEKAIQLTGVDTSLSAFLQVHVTNMGNALKAAGSVAEKREVLYSFLNYQLDTRNEVSVKSRV